MNQKLSDLRHQDSQHFLSRNLVSLSIERPARNRVILTKQRSLFRENTSRNGVDQMQRNSWRRMARVCAFGGESRLAGLQFQSEAEFDKGVSVLLSKKQLFEVIGFDVLLVPLQSIARYERILRCAGIRATHVSVSGATTLKTAAHNK
jgi:hypothetical protein